MKRLKTNNQLKYPSAEDILRTHSIVIDATGGSHGVRDLHAIRTLEDLPRQSAFGVELYPSLFLKTAVYIRNIIFSHPFVDGNKRTAMTAADVFLELNGYYITVSEGGIENFALTVVSKRMELAEIAEWVKKHTKPIPKRRSRKRH